MVMFGVVDIYKSYAGARYSIGREGGDSPGMCHTFQSALESGESTLQRLRLEV